MLKDVKSTSCAGSGVKNRKKEALTTDNPEYAEHVGKAESKKRKVSSALGAII
jgi:hypothetical protein